MHKVLLTSLIICVAALWASCGKDPKPAPYVSTARPVFVVCEGSLGVGNSALTLYADSSNIIEDVYAKTNGHSLGDVFQSMTLAADNYYFLCINNSDRIVVISKGSLQDIGAISIPKPRYVLQVSDTKAYVSTLFSNKVYVINPRTLQVTGVIAMPHQNPEGMALIGSKAYICTWDTAATAIYPVDTATNTIGAPIAAGRAPQEILQDGEGMLWVLSGNKSSGVEAKLTRLDPATGAALASYSFGGADPLRPVFNNTKDTLYFIEVSYTGASANSGVYRMGIHDAALPGRAFIAAAASPQYQYFYGLGIHPETGFIYVADPKGFLGRGDVAIYRPDGSFVQSFQTGVGPGHFLFE